MYEQIKEVRLKNNTNTVNILRLAFSHSPEEAKQLLIKVNEWDKKISVLLEELIQDSRREYEEILNDLERLRAENNEWWMELMKLAHLNSPKKYDNLFQKAKAYGNEVKSILENEQ